jgi:hypothetical protein
MFCGAEKFGAFTPCSECQRVPTTIEDRAKSLMLSDHNFPPEQLHRFTLVIESGADLPWDPVALAISAELIAEHDYYRENITASGRLCCMHCKKEFTPEDEQVLCSGCRSERDPEFKVCRSCPAMFEHETQFCPKCGIALSALNTIHARKIAHELILSVRRLCKEQSVLSEYKLLGSIHRKLSPGDRASADSELEKVALYVAMIALRPYAPFSTKVHGVVTAHAFRAYRRSFLLRGANTAVAAALEERYLKRFLEYDREFALGLSEPPESSVRWMLFVADAAMKNCYRPEKKDWESTKEMVRLIAFFVTAFTETLVSLLQRGHAGVHSGMD